MTRDIFIECKHFKNWGFIPPLDLKKGGKYINVVTATCDLDNKDYEIIADYNMNFYYIPKCEKIKDIIDVIKERSDVN